MTKPVTIPNTFATATTAIPLSQLDGDFTAVATAINDANTYSNYAADTGSANAYVVTFSGVSTSYSAGLRIQFKAGNANTGASTINVNAQGAKNITYQDASTLASGAIAVNSIVDVMYDGTQFLLMNDPAGATGGDVTGPASATDNAVVRFDGTTGKLVQNSVVTIADSTGDVAGVGALTASGNLTLSGGTANGVLYLNGSKAATSGSALTFDGSTFSVAGEVRANATFRSSDGTNIGIFGSNVLAAGVIGVTSSNAIPLAFGVGASEAMRLTSTGLGIGTSSLFTKFTVQDTERFEVSGGSGFTYSQSLNAARTATVEHRSYGSFLTWWTGAAGSQAERMRLDASGNLGIGTTTPISNGGYGGLSLNGTSGALFSMLTNGTESSRIASIGDQTSIQCKATTGYITFVQGVSGGTERARIDTSGNLLVGTTNNVWGARLTTIGAGQGAHIETTSITDPGFEVAVASNGTSQNGITVYSAAATTTTMAVRSNGNIVNTNNSYGAISDVKLKENIVDATPKLEKLNQVRVVNFNMIGSQQKQIGVIAQELEQIFPSMIDESPDRDAEGNDLGTTTKSVKYSVFVPMLIKAIQEQQALIESLTSRVSQLEGA